MWLVCLFDERQKSRTSNSVETPPFELSISGTKPGANKGGLALPSPSPPSTTAALPSSPRPRPPFGLALALWTRYVHRHSFTSTVTTHPVYPSPDRPPFARAPSFPNSNNMKFLSLLALAALGANAQSSDAVSATGLSSATASQSVVSVYLVSCREDDRAAGEGREPLRGWTVREPTEGSGLAVARDTGEHSRAWVSCRGLSSPC